MGCGHGGGAVVINGRDARIFKWLLAGAGLLLAVALNWYAYRARQVWIDEFPGSFDDIGKN